MTRRMYRLPAWSIIGWSLVALPSSVRGDEGFRLPSNPAAWLNSPPLTNDMLAGKAALLWFYEEGCPRCREKWPEMIAAAKKFDGKPVVFIAVNSGNSRVDVQQYAREVQLSWPVVVDGDRSLEKSAGVGEISLQNIYQAKMLLPDGRLDDADWSDIEGSVTGALAEAKWRVEPSEVAEPLKGAWLQVEFGNFGAAAPLLKKHLNSPKADVKTSAQKLNAAVLKELAVGAEAARQAREAEELWKSYKAYALLAARFRGFDLPADVLTALKELGAEETVRAELAASKQWETVQRALGPAGAAPSKAVVGQLQRLVHQYPNTEAAAGAQAALTRLTPTP